MMIESRHLVLALWSVSGDCSTMLRVVSDETERRMATHCFTV